MLSFHIFPTVALKMNKVECDWKLKWDLKICLRHRWIASGKWWATGRKAVRGLN